MIKSFRHRGVERFFESGSKAGIQPQHATRLSLRLAALDVAGAAQEMDLPGWQWHAVRGELAEYWAVSVNGNWRLTFTFDENEAILVDYQDDH